MDKELIQRLAAAAYLGQCNAGRRVAAPFDLLNQTEQAMWEGAAKAVAALVVEECAKALEEGHTITLQDNDGAPLKNYNRPPDPSAAHYLRRRFGHRERYEPLAAPKKPPREMTKLPHWLDDVLHQARAYQNLKKAGQLTIRGVNSVGVSTVFTFDVAWLRDTSDKDVLETIEIMERQR